MTTVSFSNFRRNLAKFLNIVEDDCEEIVITRGKGRKAVVVSLDEYESLQETAYLLSSPKNRKHLEESIREIERGETVTMDL